MSSCSAAVLERLRVAAKTSSPVRIVRDHDWWAEDIHGFVVGLSDSWVVVQRLSDAVFLDGYEIIRLQDVTEVEEDRENGYVERAVQAQVIPVVDVDLPREATTAEVLRAAADHSALICVHPEQHDENALFIGHLVGLGEQSFDLQLIGPRGVWEAQPVREPYEHVTRIGFGDRYSRALERFGDQRPTPVPVGSSDPAGGCTC